MSATNDTNDFAFGRNCVDDCQCPAMTAGFNPDGTGVDHVPGLLEAAEWYDSLVAKDTGEMEGVIAEGFAKEKWLEMMNEMKEIDPEAYSAAENVAAYLDWI